MLSKKVNIVLRDVNEGRPYAAFVQLAGKFSSAIFLINNNRRINAKSIMGVMTLHLSAGDEVTLEIDGVDEDDAMTELEGYLKGR